MTEVLPSPEECVYSKEKVAYQVYFLYAIGGKRLYDLDSLDHVAFGALIGEGDNLRSSGMNKRIEKMAEAKVIDLFQERALAGYNSAGLIKRKDCIAYSDSHVVEIWVNKSVTMAKHGTKNRKVKAINAHYLIGSDSGTPLAKEYTQGNKRLHSAIPQLAKKADRALAARGCKLKMICFDKGGISLTTLKALAKAGKGFLCWGKRTRYVKKQIARLRDKRFRWERKKEIRQDGKIKKVTEKIADTTTYLKGWGKIRTIVVQLPEVEGGERLWMYTNKLRKEYDCVELREMMRYKQRQENFSKTRKYKSALDSFVGGRCKIKPLSRPSKKQHELLAKQDQRLEKRIEKNRDYLFAVKELRANRLLKPDLAKRETAFLERKIKHFLEQKERTEEKICWAEGGKRPKFIKPRYEVELNKQKLVNEFQDIMLLSKKKTLGEFIACYREALQKEGCYPEEISRRMENLDVSAIEKELFNLRGRIIHDRTEKKMTVIIEPQGREYFRKALEIFLHQLNEQKAEVDYGDKEKYRLYFCLAPPG